MHLRSEEKRWKGENNYNYNLKESLAEKSLDISNIYIIQVNNNFDCAIDNTVARRLLLGGDREIGDCTAAVAG